MTNDEAESVRLLVDAFGTAMTQMDWAAARHAWTQLVAGHPWVLDGHDEWLWLDTALQLNELAARQTRYTH